MALKITLRELDDVSIVTLEGRLVFGEGSNALREQLKSMLASGRRRIVLNMAALGHMDSSGLATLAAAHHGASRSGGALKLAALAPSFQALLRAIGLLGTLAVYDSDAAAIESFQK